MTEKISWNTTRLGAISALGVLLFIINALTGMLIVLATGIPAGGAVIMLFIVPMMLVLYAFLIPLFPSCTIASLVWGILALAVPILGPPGFLPKIIITIAFGLGCDIPMFFLRKREKLATVISSWGSTYSGAIVNAIIFILFLPSELIAKALPLFWPVMGLIVVFSPLGGLCGWKIFDKIRERAIVVRLRGE